MGYYSTMNNCENIINFHVWYCAIKILRTSVDQNILIHADKIFADRHFCNIVDYVWTSANN